TPAPGDFYAVSKYSSEMLAGCYTDRFATCILRLYYPYGPGQEVVRLIPRLANRLRAGRSVRVHRSGRPHPTPTLIGAVVVAFERAVEEKWSGVLNVAGDETVNIRTLTKRVGRLLGFRPVFDETGEEPGDRAGANARVKEHLGDWPTVTLDEGLQRTF